MAFAPFTVPSRNMRVTVRAGNDALATDNVFNLVVSPSAPVRIVVVDSGNRPGAGLYLTRALSDRRRAEVRDPQPAAGDRLGRRPAARVRRAAQRRRRATRRSAAGSRASCRMAAACSSPPVRGPRGRRRPTFFPRRCRSRSTSRAASRRASARSSTAIRCSKCSARRAAAISRRRASTPIAR